MDAFGLIPALETYCENNNILFILGTEAYVNCSQIIDNTEFTSGNTLILIADFNATPTYAGSQIDTVTYNGLLAIGRKIDYTDELESSRATLDETYQQKFDRRLFELGNLLTTIIGEVSCENDLQIGTVNLRMDINKYDLNADFVAATVTLIS